MKKILLLVIIVLFLTEVKGQWLKTNCPDNSSILSVVLKGDSIFAGTVEFMYLSTDKGNTWSTLFNGLPYFGHFRSALVKDSNIFIGTGNGVYLSINNADTFVLVANCSCPNVSQIVSNGNDVYVITSGLNKGIFRSSDYGLTWTILSNNLPLDVSGINDISFFGNKILLGTNAGLLITANDGLTWTYMNQGLPGLNIHSVCVNGNVFLAGTEYGVYRSGDNDTNWVFASNGLPVNYWAGSILIINNKLLVGGPYGGGCYISDNNGDSWINASNGLNSLQTLVFAHSEDTMYVGTGAVSGFYTGGLYKRPLSELVNTHECEDLSEIQLYPNPTNALVFLSLKEIDDESGISIFDISGQFISKKQIKSTETSINLRSLSPGIYFLKICTKKGTITKKIIRY